MMSVINDKPSHDDSSKEKSVNFGKSHDSATNLISSGVNTGLHTRED
jgi:hypothetical protein